MTNKLDYRAYREVLRLVQELHLRGYQRLRIAPGMSASGMHWRCAVTPVTNILKSHGARLRDDDDLVAHYSSGMGRELFGWRDAPGRQPSRLAEMFLERFPEVAAAGAGSDWPYAGWYVEMLHLTWPDCLPYCYSDWVDDDVQIMRTVGERRVLIPLPPPGEAEETELMRWARRAGPLASGGRSESSLPHPAGGQSLPELNDLAGLSRLVLSGP